jgi:photosystem II oxygen-evolving enhancer protein 1
MLSRVLALACLTSVQCVPIKNDELDDSSARALAMALLATNPSSAAGRRQMLQGGLATAAALGGAQVAEAGPFTRAQLDGLTYQEIKGTGLANTCVKVEGGGTSSIPIGGLKSMNEFCLEPTSFEVINEDGKVEKSKVTTRQTYTLTGIEGKLSNDGGKLTFTEKDGIDYAATTVQRPGGERVPFLFTVKNLVAQAKSSAGAIEPGFEMAGKFTVPSYRTGLFLDPKGRGMVTGYDQAVALPALQAAGDESLFAENNKKFDVLPGNIELKVTAVNKELGEIGGVFVQQQPSDTDLGGKKPITIQLKGSWFATVE